VRSPLGEDRGEIVAPIGHHVHHVPGPLGPEAAPRLVARFLGDGSAKFRRRGHPTGRPAHVHVPVPPRHAERYQGVQLVQDCLP